MSNAQNIKFNSLLAAALPEVVEREGRDFLGLDVSGIKDDPRFKKRILRLAEGKRPTPTRVHRWRVLLVAALLTVCLLFSACMFIPSVRESVWSTIVEWYDKYIAVSFEPQGDGGNYPLLIEKTAVADYVPSGCQPSDVIEQTLFRSTTYRDTDGETAFQLVQTTIDAPDDLGGLKVNSKNGTATNVSIGDHEGLLVSYPDGTSYLAWQDEQYQYWLYGIFESQDDLLRIARSVRLE